MTQPITKTHLPVFTSPVSHLRHASPANATCPLPQLSLHGCVRQQTRLIPRLLSTHTLTSNRPLELLTRSPRSRLNGDSTPGPPSALCAKGWPPPSENTGAPGGPRELPWHPSCTPRRMRPPGLFRGATAMLPSRQPRSPSDPHFPRWILPASTQPGCKRLNPQGKPTRAPRCPLAPVPRGALISSVPSRSLGFK